MNDEITIRDSLPGDRPAIARLAALDGRAVTEAEALLGFVRDELRAALPLSGGEALADPFHPTAALVELLQFHEGARRKPSRRRRGPLRIRVAFAARAW